MANGFSDVSEYLSDTVHPIDYNQPYTVAYWKRLASDTNDYGHSWAASYDPVEQGGSYLNSDFLGTSNDGVSFRGGAVISGSGGFPTGSALTVGQYHFVAARRTSATLWEALLDGVVDLTDTTNITGRAAVAAEYMGRFNGGYRHDGSVAMFFAWQAALTDKELRAQMRATFPLRIANLHRFSPMLPGEGLFDVKRGWNWTANGAVSDEDGPILALLSRPWRRTFQTSGGGGSQSISPDSIAARTNFGSLTVSPGAVAIAPDSLVSKVIFGAFTAANVAPQAIVADSVLARGIYGSITYGADALAIALDGYVAKAAHGDFTVSPGSVTLSMSGLTAKGVFGNLDVVLIITMDSVTAKVSLGGMAVAVGAVTVSPDSIIAQTAFGPLIVNREGDLAALVLQSRVHLHSGVGVG